MRAQARVGQTDPAQPFRVDYEKDGNPPSTATCCFADAIGPVYNALDTFGTDCSAAVAICAGDEMKGATVENGNLFDFHDNGVYRGFGTGG